MLSIVLASLAIASAQPAGASQPLVVELCNDTPARVAYSISYPAGARSRRQRGWLTVEPGQCLEGSIGNTTGGTAHVHAMSGSYRWPRRETGALVCAPANSHDGIAQTPPCSAPQREVAASPIEIRPSRQHYTLEARVRCQDLSAEDAMLCETGLTDDLGFAELVRSVEACNYTDDVVPVAVVGQTANRAWEVSGWFDVAGGECSQVWRGHSSQALAYIHAPIMSLVRRETGVLTFCVDEDASFNRLIDVLGENQCPDGTVMRDFRQLRFSRQVDRLTYVMGAQSN